MKVSLTGYRQPSRQRIEKVYSIWYNTEGDIYNNSQKQNLKKIV